MRLSLPLTSRILSEQQAREAVEAAQAEAAAQVAARKLQEETAAQWQKLQEESRGTDTESTGRSGGTGCKGTGGSRRTGSKATGRSRRAGRKRHRRSAGSCQTAAGAGGYYAGPAGPGWYGIQWQADCRRFVILTCAQTPLKGLSVSVLGDSISTYQGIYSRWLCMLLP